MEVVMESWWRNLTPRESQVAFLVSRGLSNKEVAQHLGLSDGTVKLYVHNILQKLDAKNRYVLIRQAAVSGDAGNAKRARRWPN
jgi:two-component system nitrate/nitrite response regulator NarL